VKVINKIKRLVKKKEQKAKLAERTKKINEQIDALEFEVVSLMDETGLQNIKLDTGELAYVNVKSYINVTDRAKLMKWLKHKGMSDMFTVNTKTIQGFVNERIKSNESVPPGIEQYTERTIGIRRS